MLSPENNAVYLALIVVKFMLYLMTLLFDVNIGSNYIFLQIIKRKTESIKKNYDCIHEILFGISLNKYYICSQF